MADVKTSIDLLRSKYYVCRIDAARGVRLLVPHQFDTVSAPRGHPRLFIVESNLGKQAYSGFSVYRGSQILDGRPLPIEFYMPTAHPVE